MSRCTRDKGRHFVLTNVLGESLVAEATEDEENHLPKGSGTE